ncbi:MAG: signal peptidase I [Clostridia bacterium]|nr:signal peptidase I [Clostridia bacterium]
MENNDKSYQDSLKASASEQIAVNAKTERAFEKASEKLHKHHSELNRTFNLPFVLMILCVIVAAFAVRQFIAEPTLVDGESMETTLMDRERLFVEKVSLWFGEPQRGDIVIVHYPNSSSRYVKRIIAMPGESIEIKHGFVYINDEQLDESAYAGDWYGRINSIVQTVGSVDGRYTVPEGHYFVIGDNRNESKDSRSDEVGAIPFEQVLGRVRAVIFPFSRMRGV